jgi:DNA polymerase-1
MHFANCQGHLDDEYFIGAVTASVIGGRSLGRNGADDDLQLSNEIEFSLSANSGLTFRTDVEPRTRRISLFFAEENPNSRVFPIPDLHEWVVRHRWELISAVATLVHTWLQAGEPKGPTPFSSFKRWGDVVGGIMAFHGLGDPCQPHADDDGCPADRETAAMGAVFTLMYEAHPESWKPKSEIYTVLKDRGGEIDALDLFNGLEDKSDKTRFGLLLRRYVGRELVGITLLVDGTRESQRARFKFTQNGGPKRKGVFPGREENMEALPGESPPTAANQPIEDGSSPEKLRTAHTLHTSDNRNLQEEINRKPKKYNNEKGLINSIGRGAPGGVRGEQSAQPLLRRSDLDLVAADLKDAHSIALDLETYGPHKGDGLDPQKGHIRLLALCREGGPAHILDLRAIGYDLGPLHDVLSQAEIIAHNAKFDLGWLAAKCGIRLAAVFCTCTASRLLDAGSTLRHGLDTVLERHLGIKPGPDHSLSDWGALILTEDQLKYAAADVEPLHSLAEVLRSKVAAAGLDKVMELEMDLLPVVVDMERTGVGVDIDQLKAIRTEAEATTRSAEAEVRSLLDAPDLNLSSPKQLLAALGAAGFDLPNTAEETLKGAADESGVISALLRHRSAQKVAQQPATLIKAVGRDGRLRCSFNPTGTATGRFSSSSPNLQNIGRGAIRSAFTPAPGKCLIVADYSQIELRIAAVVAEDQKMLAAYRDGADLHRETAAAVLEKPLEGVTKSDRQLAKAVNFGLLYGQGAPGLVRYAAGSYGVDIEEEDAARIRALFFARYKGLSRWHSKAWEKARAKATEVRTCLGRRRLIPPEASEWERFTALVNTEVQGGAADGMKLALLALAHRLPTGAAIISAVHDEVIVEAPTELADQIRELTQTVMIDSMAGLYPVVPIEVEAHVCRHWGEK